MSFSFLGMHANLKFPTRINFSNSLLMIVLWSVQNRNNDVGPMGPLYSVRLLELFHQIKISTNFFDERGELRCWWKKWSPPNINFYKKNFVEREEGADERKTISPICPDRSWWEAPSGGRFGAMAPLHHCSKILLNFLKYALRLASYYNYCCLYYNEQQ